MRRAEKEISPCLFDEIEIKVRDEHWPDRILTFSAEFLDKKYNEWKERFEYWKNWCIEEKGFVGTEYHWWKSRFNDDEMDRNPKEIGLFKALWKYKLKDLLK